MTTTNYKQEELDFLTRSITNLETRGSVPGSATHDLLSSLYKRRTELSTGTFMPLTSPNSFVISNNNLI